MQESQEAGEHHLPAKELEENLMIASLREQVHRSFLQINEMERFYHMESEERQAAWKQKEEDYKKQIQQLELNLREKMNNSFTVDLGELDDSHFLDNIAPANESLRDSGIYNLQQILAESEKSAKVDPEQRMQMFKGLERDIARELGQLTPLLKRVFQQCHELCIDYLRRWQELRNLCDQNQVLKSKMQEAYNILTKYRNNEARLKSQVKQLKFEVEGLRARYLSEVRSKDVIESNLHKLEEHVEQTQAQYNKLQGILRDQTFQIEQLRSEHSILNENHEVNDSKSHINTSVSNMSTLSNFLTRLNKPTPKGEKLERIEKPQLKGPLKFTQKSPSEPTTPVSGLNLFKKKMQARTQN